MNTVNLIGNVAQAPEYNTFPSGKRNARVNIVVNNYRPNSVPMYIKCEFWENSADNLEKCNVRKGTKIAITGSLTPNNWKKKIGETEIAIKTLFVRVLSFDVLSPKGETSDDESISSLPDETLVDMSISLLPESSPGADDGGLLPTIEAKTSPVPKVLNLARTK